MRDQDDLWLFREQTADPDELDADFMDWLKDGLSDDVIDWVAVNAGRDSWTTFGLDLALYWTEAFGASRIAFRRPASYRRSWWP